MAVRRLYEPLCIAFGTTVSSPTVPTYQLLAVKGCDQAAGHYLLDVGPGALLKTAYRGGPHAVIRQGVTITFIVDSSK